MILHCCAPHLAVFGTNKYTSESTKPNANRKTNMTDRSATERLHKFCPNLNIYGCEVSTEEFEIEHKTLIIANLPYLHVF